MTELQVSACASLAEICRRRRENASDKRDALTAFSGIHLCICERVDKRVDLSDELGILNAEFVKVFVAVYEAHQRREYGNLHDLWVLALREYKLHPQRFVRILLRMAQAHIFVDLRRLLCRFNVSEADYESVADDIEACLKQQKWGFREDHVVDLFWINLLHASNPLAMMSVRNIRRHIYAQAQRDKKFGCPDVP